MVQGQLRRSRAQVIGLLKPNDLGLFDILGNAVEWCHNRYLPDFENDMSGASEGNSAVDIRVLRGGCFVNLARTLRSAERFWFPATYHDDRWGFRVARSHY